MTRPPEQRLLTEANAGLHATDPGTPLGAALATLTAPHQGQGADRPAAPGIGYQYFDTTLNKPIWHNGTVWVDATGATA